MNKILYILLGLLIYSCSKKLTNEEYSAYISNPENGLRKNQTIGQYELSLMYEPVDYILSQEGQHKNQEERKKELSEFEHFQFRIKLVSGGNILQHDQNELHYESQRIHHLSFESTQDFQLISNQDTVPCVSAIYARNYNITPTIDIALSFKSLSKENDWCLLYTDKCFSIGRIKFLFKKEDLENIPQLKS